ncbi:stAR-related lipid transfer protein 6 isoform X3 [Pantherophis guttatus]|uniref:StAR-related lipid transfer protein 6 isoform X3 n=1 Tax=Pantherophis guttatus TaxID=94885 RepID=A0ABM3ZCV8_PANGU|nr:stAR-related lipid transfer protein 6 isoform X3 [Pantherophis guttatus]
MPASHTALYCWDFAVTAGSRGGEGGERCPEMDYKKTAEEVSAKVLFYLQDTEGWKVVKSTPEYRSKWDKSLQSYQIVEIIDQDTFIYRSITHSYGFGMVSQRDFVYMLHVKTYDGNLMTTNSISVVHPDLLPTPAYIRGTTFSSGYVCLPLPENPEHTRLTIILQVDLGGFLTPSVINSVMPMTLLNFVTDCKSGLKMLRETIT